MMKRKPPLTDAEYRVLKRLYICGQMNAGQFSYKERRILRRLHRRGLVEYRSPDDRKNNFQNREVVLDENAGDKTDGAEKDAKPELKPRSARIFTPAFVCSLFLRLFASFFAGVITAFLIKKFLVP